MKRQMERPIIRLFFTTTIFAILAFIGILYNGITQNIYIFENTSAQSEAVIIDLWHSASQPEKQRNSDQYYAEILFVADSQEIYATSEISKQFYDAALVGSILEVKYELGTPKNAVIDKKFQRTHVGLFLFLGLLFINIVLVLILSIIKNAQFLKNIICISKSPKALISPRHHKFILYLLSSVAILNIVLISPILASSFEASLWTLTGWSNLLATFAAWALPVITIGLIRFIFDELFVISKRFEFLCGFHKNSTKWRSLQGIISPVVWSLPKT